MDKSNVYTYEQVLQFVDELIRNPDVIGALIQKRVDLDNSMTQQSSPSTKLTFSVKEAADLLGISKPKMYDLLREGEIRSLRVGKKIIIPRKALDDWLSGGNGYGEKAC